MLLQFLFHKIFWKEMPGIYFVMFIFFVLFIACYYKCIGFEFVPTYKHTSISSRKIRSFVVRLNESILFVIFLALLFSIAHRSCDNGFYDHDGYLSHGRTRTHGGHDHLPGCITRLDPHTPSQQIFILYYIRNP